MKMRARALGCFCVRLLALAPIVKVATQSPSLEVPKECGEKCKKQIVHKVYSILDELFDILQLLDPLNEYSPDDENHSNIPNTPSATLNSGFVSVIVTSISGASITSGSSLASDLSLNSDTSPISSSSPTSISCPYSNCDLESLTSEELRPSTSLDSEISSTEPTGSSQVPLPPPQETAIMPHNGYKSVAYFTNWGIYGRKYTPDMVPIDQLTHILYSFGDNGPDGTVRLTDSWADEEIHWKDLGDSWNEQGNNLFGCLKQLNLAKKRNRNLKLMLSIGGWTYTNTDKHMDKPASTDAGRKQFAKSCVDLIKNYGFDGIDIDWEYPQNKEQGHQLLLLLKDIRGEMDNYARNLTQHGNQTYHFELSIAAPAGKPQYEQMYLKEMGQVLDFINIMGYDFSGVWDKVAAHQTNLYRSKSCPSCTPFALDDVIKAYTDAGVPHEKIVVGMPLFGRAFTHTDGFGKPYNGIGAGSWENGIWDFKVLPQAGALEYYDKDAGASYSYDNKSRTVISYDTVGAAITKTQYIQQRGLGGAMWWELSGDKPNPQDSIIHNVVKQLGGYNMSHIERKQNLLTYPHSKWDNLRSGFPKDNV